MSLLVSFRVAGRRVTVVGGGAVASRKVRTLLDAGADVRVVAPRIAIELRADAGERLAIEERAYRTGDLDGATLAVAATGDAGVDAAVMADARAAGIPALDASGAGESDFAMLATTRLGDMRIGVDSGGSTPAFARRTARDLRERFGEGYGSAARILAHARTYLQAILPAAERAPILRQMSELPIAELAAMDPIQVEHLAEELVDRHATGAPDPEVTTTAVCASRASALAMTQTRLVAARLARRGIATTILPVTTTGDRVVDRALNAIGSENVFVTELENALREKRADYAVHSCKDLPSALASDMTLVAISEREDPRDAYCSQHYPTFADLPAGARVGTSSPRRRAQLQALRSDLVYDDVRGNVDTRLRKLRDGEYDAIVLAMAGLNRLRARAAHTVPFDVDEVVPAAAQGALAIETRAEPSAVATELRAAVNHDETERCIAAERATLRRLRAGCNAPIGVHARYDGATMHLTIAAHVGEPLRSVVIGDVASIDQAEALGLRLAESVVGRLHPLAGRTVVLFRKNDHPSRIAASLRALGADVLEVRPSDEPPAHAPDLLVFPSSTSVRAAQPYLETLASRPLVAAMGPESAAAAKAAGFPPDAVAPEPTAESLVGAVRTLLETKAP